MYLGTTLALRGRLGLLLRLRTIGLFARSFSLDSSFPLSSRSLKHPV